jgi:hypothetical protein
MEFAIRIALALLKLIFVFVSPVLLAASLRVGTDASCTHNSITAAVATE